MSDFEDVISEHEERLTNMRRLLARMDMQLQQANARLGMTLLRDGKVAQASDSISLVRLTLQDVLGEVDELQHMADEAKAF